MKHEQIAIPIAPAWRLRRARVPQSLLAAPVPGAVPDLDGDCLLDIHLAEGRVRDIVAAQPDPVDEPHEIDLEGRMVWPTLVDMHTHLDKGEVIPRIRTDGTLRDAALKNAEDHARWTLEDMIRRMRFALRCAYVQGVSAIRTHLDYRGPRAAESWDALDEMRREWRGRVELQGVGLAMLDLFSTPAGEDFAALIAERRGVLGGVTDVLAGNGVVTSDLMDRWLDRYFELAGRHGLDVDFHADQTADVSLFFLPHIARAVLRTGFTGRVVVGHCVTLALQPEKIVRQTLELCSEARLSFVTLPTPMMYLQEREAGRTPRWRGVTLAHEIRAAGLPLALAGDNCRDSWFPYGDHDMVDIFRQGVRIFQLDHPVAGTPAMVGPIPASIIGLPGFGSLAVGSEARLILFRARTLNEILSRPQSDRIVLDRGRRIEEALPDYAELD
jgi:cytosine deaminase